MNVFYDSEQIPRLDKVVVTVGTMDGVHEGHAAIISRLVTIAATTGSPSLVVTFDPHPRSIVTGTEVPLLTTVQERAEILNSLGVSNLFVLKFDRAVAALTPDEFVQTILVEKLGMKHIVVGYDHGFGRGRKGNVDILRRLGLIHGFQVTEVPEKTANQQSLSSSSIRTLIENHGQVHKASTFLGRPYRLTGTVIHGDKRGRSIGFPTANIEVEATKLIPKTGVYKVEVTFDGRSLLGMLNIGTRPTFGGLENSIEVHIIDFEGDLYGKEIHVDFLQRLRDEKSFESVDALKKQLSLDRDRCIGSHRSLVD